MFRFRVFLRFRFRGFFHYSLRRRVLFVFRCLFRGLFLFRFRVFLRFRFLFRVVFRYSLRRRVLFVFRYLFRGRFFFRFRGFLIFRNFFSITVTQISRLLRSLRCALRFLLLFTHAVQHQCFQCICRGREGHILFTGIIRLVSCRCGRRRFIRNEHRPGRSDDARNRRTHDPRCPVTRMISESQHLVEFRLRAFLRGPLKGIEHPLRSALHDLLDTFFLNRLCLLADAVHDVLD